MWYSIVILGMILTAIAIMFIVNRICEYKEFQKSTTFPGTYPFKHDGLIGSKYLPPVPGCKCGCVEYAEEQKKAGTNDTEDGTEGR